MCKYCDTKPRIINGAFGRGLYGEAEKNLAESRFERCKIVSYNNEYVINVCGMDSADSLPIKYCPFCGKYLKE